MRCYYLLNTFFFFFFFFSHSHSISAAAIRNMKLPPQTSSLSRISGKNGSLAATADSSIKETMAESDLGRDRLSELPDSLILAILSLLEMKDVVKTTVLSKRWEDLWISVPCLHFSGDYPSFVRGALAKWRGANIRKFTLAFRPNHHPPAGEIVDSWLLVPIQKQVEELRVNLGPHMDAKYRPPQRLYSYSSLTKLSLSYCNLIIQKSVNWYQLRSLTIEHPTELTREAVDRILSGAPRLEELVLWSCEMTEILNIRSTSLKILEFGRANSSCKRTLMKGMMKIWAPNLLSLDISGCFNGFPDLDVPSLINVTLCLDESCDIRGDEGPDGDPTSQETFEKIFRSICHAEKVTLSDLCLQWLNCIEESEMITFSNAKFLKLYAGDAERRLLDILDIFPLLTTLVVELHEEYYKPEIDSLISMTDFPSPSIHKLKTVEISWCTCDTSIIPAIQILLQNAHMLDKMVFRPKWSCDHRCDRKLWLKAREKVLSMQKSSPTAKVDVLMYSLGGIRI